MIQEIIFNGRNRVDGSCITVFIHGNDCPVLILEDPRALEEDAEDQPPTDRRPTYEFREIEDINWLIEKLIELRDEVWEDEETPDEEAEPEAQ